MRTPAAPGGRERGVVVNLRGSKVTGTLPHPDRPPQHEVHLRPVPLPRSVVRSMWHDACAIFIAADLTVLRALALASVACISRVEGDDADFLRAVAAGEPLSSLTAPRFHRLVRRLRAGGGR